VIKIFIPFPRGLKKEVSPMALEKGLVGEVEHGVTPETTATNYANPGVEVLATPVVVAWIEEAAMQATQGHLEKGQTTVGTVVNIKHMAATPLGMKVKARAHLKEADGRRLVFAVEAFDEMEKIAEGEHERFVVGLERFMSKVAEKEKKR